MNFDKDHKFSFFVYLPITVVCMAIAHAYGLAHQVIYSPWLYFTDLTSFAGIGFGAAIAFAIFRAAPDSKRRLLLWIIVPVYAVAGLKLGYITGGSLFGLPIQGAFVGGALGGIAGNMVRLAIPSRSNEMDDVTHKS
jgi:hypothetical protein